jgi:FtsH-binding integral membrane protein
MAVLFSGWIKWLVILSPLPAVIAIHMAMPHTRTVAAASAMLLGFAALMGLSLSAVFAVYTTLSLVSAFMGASILFAVMSAWGYFTKQDLSGFGNYLLIALIAVVAVSLLNLFLGSTVLQMLVSAAAVIVFLALTAYDTQEIRNTVSSPGQTHVPEILGALSLYLNFINIFVNLLSLFGDKD